MWERLQRILRGDPQNRRVRPARRSSPVRVLLVDDSAFIRLVLTRRLNQNSSVEVVGDASGAGEALQRIAETEPDIIVLDMEMPRGSGLDLLRALEPEQRARCLLFSSLHPEHSSLQTCLDLGAGAILRKSTRELDLEGLVQRLTDAILALDARVRSR